MRTGRVLLTGLPAPLFETAVTYLADVLRECQLVRVDHDQGAPVDETLAVLADGLMPDLEELRDLFRSASITADGPVLSVAVDLQRSDASMLAHLQMQLVQLRYLGQRGSLLITSDPGVTEFLAWVWDEAADQLSGRPCRPYRTG